MPPYALKMNGTAAEFSLRRLLLFDDCVRIC